MGFGHAGYEEGRTAVWVGDWRFALEGGVYQAEVKADDFAYRLSLRPDGPPLLNGAAGFSRKGPDPRQASYYYSRPRLAVSGTLSLDGRAQPVSGQAWLDHEWSSELLPEGAQGWDWIGLNLDDGGGLMAFRLRDIAGKALIPFATSGGSDIRDSVAELQQLLPKSQFGKSLILQNPNNDKKIQDWLTENGW